MIVYTGRVGVGYGYESLDITVKSGKRGRIFVPTWDMVMGLKRGEITEGEYRERYLGLLRARYRGNSAAFEEVVRWIEGQGAVVLCCYCREGAFCHRDIVAQHVLPGLAARLGLEYEYRGFMRVSE